MANRFSMNVHGSTGAMDMTGEDSKRESNIEFFQPSISFEMIENNFSLDEKMREAMMSGTIESQKVFSGLMINQLENQGVRVHMAPFEGMRKKIMPPDPPPPAPIVGDSRVTSVPLAWQAEKEIFPVNSVMHALNKVKTVPVKVSIGPGTGPPQPIQSIQQPIPTQIEEGEVVQVVETIEEHQPIDPKELTMNKFLMTFDKFYCDYIWEIKKAFKSLGDDEVIESYHFSGHIVSKKTKKRISRAMHFDMNVVNEKDTPKDAAKCRPVSHGGEQQFLLCIPQYLDMNDLAISFEFTRDYNPKYEDLFQLYVEPQRVAKTIRKLRKFEGFADGFGDLRVKMGHFSFDLVQILPKEIGDFDEIKKKEIFVTKSDELINGISAEKKNKFPAYLDILVGQIPSEEDESMIDDATVVELTSTVPRNLFITHFYHNVRIYPKKINFGKEIICKMVIRNNDKDVYNDNDDMNLIRRQTYDGETVPNVFSGMCEITTKGSTFSDEIVLQLPMDKVNERTHVLFQFYKISPKKKKELLKLVAYTTLTVLENKSTLFNGEYNLDVVFFGKGAPKNIPNYLALSEKTKATQINKQKRKLFNLEVSSTSVVYPREFDLQGFLLGMVQKNARWAHKNLLKSFEKKFEYYIQVMPAILEFLLFKSYVEDDMDVNLGNTSIFIGLLNEFTKMAITRGLIKEGEHPIFLQRYVDSHFTNMNDPEKLLFYPFWIVTECCVAVYQKEVEDTKDDVRLHLATNSWFVYGLIFKSFALAIGENMPVDFIVAFLDMIVKLCAESATYILSLVRLMEIQVKDIALNKTRSCAVRCLNDSVGFLMRKLLTVLPQRPQGFVEAMLHHNYIALFRDFSEANMKYPKLLKWVDVFVLRFVDIILKDKNTIPLLFLRFDNIEGIEFSAKDVTTEVTLGSFLIDEISMGLYNPVSEKRIQRIKMLVDFLTNIDQTAELIPEEESAVYSEIIFPFAMHFVLNIADYFHVSHGEIYALEEELEILQEEVKTKKRQIAQKVDAHSPKKTPEKPTESSGGRLSILGGKRNPKPPKGGKVPVSFTGQNQAKELIVLNQKFEVIKKKLESEKENIANTEKDHLFYSILTVLYKVDQMFLSEMLINNQRTMLKKVLSFCVEIFKNFFFDSRDHKEMGIWEKKLRNNVLVMLYQIVESVFHLKDKFEDISFVKQFAELCGFFLRVDNSFFHLKVIEILQSIFEKYKEQFFKSKNQDFTTFLEKTRSDLIMLLFKSTSSGQTTAIQKLTLLFFKMSMHDYSFNGNIQRTIIQTISTISKLEKQMNAEMVVTMENFSENLYNLSENEERYSKDGGKFVECFERFFEKIRGILGNVLDVIKFREAKDSQKLVATMYILTQDDTSMLLKLVWLENLSKVHEAGKNFCEAGVCCLIRCAFIYKYLEKIEKHYMCKALPFEKFVKSCPPLNYIKEESFEKLLASLASLSDNTLNELHLNVEGLVMLIEKAVELFAKESLFEYCLLLSDILIRYYSVEGNHKMLSELHSACSKSHKILSHFSTSSEACQGDGKVGRYFPRYYYVMIVLGGSFRAEQNLGNGIEFVIKTPKLTQLGEFMAILKNAFKYEYGEQNIIIESYVKLNSFKNETLMKPENRSKAFFFIQQLEVLEKGSEVDWIEITDFMNNTNVKRFYFEVRMRNPKYPEKTGNELIDYLIHIIHVETNDAFPFTRLESSVARKSTVVRSPIQAAVEMLKKSVNNLNKEITKKKPMMSTLTMVIQGSVIPTVQQGIGLVVETFIVKEMELNTRLDVESLKLVKKLLGEFLVVSLKCIEKYSGMIASVPQWQYLKEFLKGYESLFKMLTKHLNRDPDFGIDLREYLMLYHQLVGRSKLPPATKKK